MRFPLGKQMFGIKFRERVYGIPARRYYFLHAGVMLLLGSIVGLVFGPPIIGAVVAGFAGWVLATYHFIKLWIER